MMTLTNSYREDLRTGVVWTYDAFGNNFGSKHGFTKYLKGSCMSLSGQHCPLKYFGQNAMVAKI